MLNHCDKMSEKTPQESSEIIEKKVLEIIQVHWEHHEEIRELLSTLKEKIVLDINSLGYVARVENQGSFVRKTYLSEDDSFDLLLILQKSDKPKVHQILDALEKRLKKDRIENNNIQITKNTGKLPYLRLIVKGELINLFVGFEVIPGEELSSIFDLIPMHSQYILTHMHEDNRNEVLLLKKFLKTIGVYRNEIGAIGFNGYLCELLIIFYGSFRKTIEAICKWRPRTIIDLKRNSERMEDVDLLTSEMLMKYYPLYVPDPLNPKNNVASDVSIDQFTSLIAAANTYLMKPDILFFEDLLCEIPIFDDIMRKIINSGREIVVLAIKREFEEPEICWQKALSIKNAFQTELFNNNYILERSKTFVSQDYYGLFISLMDIKPQISIRKEGPLITSKESLNFLRQYSKHVDVVAGPFIDNDRWVIHFTKKGQSVFEFLENLVEKNTFVLDVDSFLKIEVKEKMKVFTVNEELKEVYNRDDAFAENFYLFIERKPLWICNLREANVF